MKITRGDVALAIDIIREAAMWLNDTGKPMWSIEDITEKKLLANAKKENFHIGWIEGESAGAMILQWSDPIFWPNAKGDSGFIHKLAVRRQYAGKNVANEMIDYAIMETKRRKRKYLRLDCAGDRPKLCSFYEHEGFQQVGRKQMGIFDVAFYEMEIK